MAHGQVKISVVEDGSSEKRALVYKVPKKLWGQMTEKLERLTWKGDKCDIEVCIGRWYWVLVEEQEQEQERKKVPKSSGSPKKKEHGDSSGLEPGSRLYPAKVVDMQHKPNTNSPQHTKVLLAWARDADAKPLSLEQQMHVVSAEAIDHGMEFDLDDFPDHSEGKECDQHTIELDGREYPCRIVEQASATSPPSIPTQSTSAASPAHGTSQPRARQTARLSTGRKGR